MESHESFVIGRATLVVGFVKGVRTMSLSKTSSNARIVAMAAGLTPTRPVASTLSLNT